MRTNKWMNSCKTTTYNSWRAMRNRCLFDGNNNKNHKLKGIKICKEWINNFDKFVEDMGERPYGTTLDRINPNGDYEPSNCRWATMRQQQNNKIGLSKIEHNGQIKTIGQWAFELRLTKTQKNRAYKRHLNYGCSTFDEIFCEQRLSSKRYAERVYRCLLCNSNFSCKWRKNGKLCNNCYHRALRAAKKQNISVDEHYKLQGISWDDIAGYATLVSRELGEKDTE